VVILGFNDMAYEMAEHFRTTRRDVYLIDLDYRMHQILDFTYKGVLPAPTPRCPPAEDGAVAFLKSKLRRRHLRAAKDVIKTATLLRGRGTRALFSVKVGAGVDGGKPGSAEEGDEATAADSTGDSRATEGGPGLAPAAAAMGGSSAGKAPSPVEPPRSDITDVSAAAAAMGWGAGGGSGGDEGGGVGQGTVFAGVEVAAHEEGDGRMREEALRQHKEQLERMLRACRLYIMNDVFRLQLQSGCACSGMLRACSGCACSGMLRACSGCACSGMLRACRLGSIRITRVLIELLVYE
jgi:hypothetical protein